MGKSPGKWIKTILFGKKPSKSSFLKVLSYFLSVIHCCSWLWSDSLSQQPWMCTCFDVSCFRKVMLVYWYEGRMWSIINIWTTDYYMLFVLGLCPFLEILTSSCHARIPYFLRSHASNIYALLSSVKGIIECGL